MLKKLVFVFLAASLCSAAWSQGALKIGHINSQELLQAMPESDSAQVKLQGLQKELEEQMELMQVEFNKKYQEYTEKQATYSEIIRQAKETELQQMNQRIQQFQTSADQDLQRKRMEIFKPVLDKANAAIADVAKENKFTYILDLSAGAVLYHAPESQDVLLLVKAKLGIKK